MSFKRVLQIGQVASVAAIVWSIATQNVSGILLLLIVLATLSVPLSQDEDDSVEEQ